MKNKDLIYLAIAIGGAFLLHKYFMNKTTSDKIVSPVKPSIPGVIDQQVIKNLVNNDIVSSMTNEVSSEYEVADTYQNFYAKQINGLSKKIPNVI